MRGQRELGGAGEMQIAIQVDEVELGAATMDGGGVKSSRRLGGGGAPAGEVRCGWGAEDDD